MGALTRLASGDGDEIWANNDSKGCGTVMRAAPFGFMSLRDDAFAEAFENARITHGHPTSALAAGYMAALVWGLARGEEPARALTHADDLLTQHPRHEETLAAVQRARELAARGAVDGAALESLGGGWVAEEALSIAVACLLTVDAGSAESVKATLWHAACHSGDSDSTAAIAGNLIGAMLGNRALPGDWLADLELRDTIERIARDLWRSLVEGEQLDIRDYPPG